MVAPGETIRPNSAGGDTGEQKCDDCGMPLPLRVCQSNAGYYVVPVRPL